MCSSGRWPFGSYTRQGSYTWLLFSLHLCIPPWCWIFLDGIWTREEEYNKTAQQPMHNGPWCHTLSCKQVKGSPAEVRPPFCTHTHKNHYFSFNLSRALSGLNHVLLQQTWFLTIWKLSVWKLSGRCKWSPRISRHLSWGWRRRCDRVEQDRIFLYICVSVHVCECLLKESVCVCVLGCVLFFLLSVWPSTYTERV